MTDTKPTPYAWTVNGTAQMFFGDYAQHDAEQEAEHIGGTARAFPLFAAPKPLTDDQVYEAIKGIDSLDALQVWRAAEAAHGITQQG